MTDGRKSERDDVNDGQDGVTAVHRPLAVIGGGGGGGGTSPQRCRSTAEVRGAHVVTWAGLGGVMCRQLGLHLTV
jgi:hypothetical protein